MFMAGTDKKLCPTTSGWDSVRPLPPPLLGQQPKYGFFFREGSFKKNTPIFGPQGQQGGGVWQNTNLLNRF